MKKNTLYRDRIVDALQLLGGHGYLSDIYQVFGVLSKDEDLPKTINDTIRRTIQEHSSDSGIFKNDGNKADLFYSIDGIGNGHWGLRGCYDGIELTQEDDAFSEGKLLLKKHLQRERNPKLIREAKKVLFRFRGICSVKYVDLILKKSMANSEKVLLKLTT